jgi:hypothetical protein
MGKRKLAATIKSTEHSTEVGRFSNQGFEIHVGGWDSGLMIDVELDKDDTPIFHIHSTGGSNQPKRRDLLYVYYPSGVSG